MKNKKNVDKSEDKEKSHVRKDRCKRYSESSGNTERY